jgi:phage repressor protein C with HTH and peptisase S24 domain
MDLGEKLVALRVARGLSQRELAQEAKVKASTISRIERGTAEPYRTTLLKIARALRVQVDALLDPHLTGDELADLVSTEAVDKTQRVPVISWTSAGTGRDWTDQGFVAGAAEEWIERPTNVRDPNAYALRVAGDSMRPLVREGDLIVIDNTKTPVPGDLVLVKTRDYGVLLKELDRQAGRIVLLSLNPAFTPIVLEESDLQFPPRKVAHIMKR